MKSSTPRILAASLILSLAAAAPKASVGTAYCSGSVNSTGQAGLLSFTGSDQVQDNDLTAHAQNLPPGEFALLLVGDRRGGVVKVGGEHGGLCIGAPFGSFRQTVGVTDDLGQIQFAVDLDHVPTVNGGRRAAVPGDRLFFQVVCRDDKDIATTNAVYVPLK